MPRTALTLPSPSRGRRRSGAGPAPGLLHALARDEVTARQLAHDLAALVRAGLVAPTGDGDGHELCFAVVEPLDRAA